MADAIRNKLSAQIIKAEMLGQLDRIKELKQELANLSAAPTESTSAQNRTSRPNRFLDESRNHRQTSKSSNQMKYDNKVKKFLSAAGSLSSMFEQEKHLTAADEAKMYIKTSAKFSRDDMETKWFAEEVDNSQAILNKPKRHKPGSSSTDIHPKPWTQSLNEPCDGCADKIPKHLMIDDLSQVCAYVMEIKPYLSDMSNLVVSNKEHSCDSFVASSNIHQAEAERLIASIREMYSSKNYRCVIMETYFKGRKFRRRDSISCDGHFQVYCLPIKEKYYERVRMTFKQALQNCEHEWSVNKKLITTDGRRIQRYLPKGLSYFWVCFDNLSNGFGHVIEYEKDFSRYFGFEILSDILGKEFKTNLNNSREKFNEQFERCRDIKIQYSKFKMQPTIQ